MSTRNELQIFINLGISSSRSCIGASRVCGVNSLLERGVFAVFSFLHRLEGSDTE